MNRSEAPNPERRSNSALLCFCLGAALCAAAYFLGIGAVIAAAFSGQDLAFIVGGVIAAAALLLLGGGGAVLMVVGGIWMVIQVIADQRGEPSEKRYRDVER